MFATPQFLGDSRSPNPQKLQETIHADVGSLILDQPLDLAIQHLQTFLNRGLLEMHLRRSYFGSREKIYLEGVRLETDIEVNTRLEQRRRYARENLDRKQYEIKELETELEVLQKEVMIEEQKLKSLPQVKGTK